MRTSSTTTRVRKIFTCVGLGGEIIFLMLAGQTNNQTLASAALTLAVASSAFSRCNVNVNLLDIAPRHATILAGLCNTVATFAAMSCPRFLEKLNSLLDMLGWRGDDCHSMYFCRSSWQKVFLMAAFLDLTALIVFAIFGSGDLQAWAIFPPRNCDDGEEMPMKTNERLR